MSFRDNLKSELKYQDIQLKELAGKTGISRNTLGNYLTGHNSIPNADSAVKIAQALGITVEYLITGKSLPPSEKIIPPKIRKMIDEILTLDDTDVDSLSALIGSMMKRYI
jgi:transcriptional regulator with XRE-family HTH domain